METYEKIHRARILINVIAGAIFCAGFLGLMMGLVYLAGSLTGG